MMCLALLLSVVAVPAADARPLVPGLTGTGWTQQAVATDLKTLARLGCLSLLSWMTLPGILYLPIPVKAQAAASPSIPAKTRV